MDSLLICGGWFKDTLTSSNTCLTFISGRWMTSHYMVEERYEHNSWQTEQGVVMMGGYDSPDSSEIVHIDGEQGEQSFSMQHSSKYVSFLISFHELSLELPAQWLTRPATLSS